MLANKTGYDKFDLNFDCSRWIRNYWKYHYVSIFIKLKNYFFYLTLTHFDVICGGRLVDLDLRYLLPV